MPDILVNLSQSVDIYLKCELHARCLQKLGIGKGQEGHLVMHDSISMVAKSQQHNIGEQLSFLGVCALIQPRVTIIPLIPE